MLSKEDMDKLKWFLELHKITYNFKIISNINILHFEKSYFNQIIYFVNKENIPYKVPYIPDSNEMIAAINM